MHEGVGSGVRGKDKSWSGWEPDDEGEGGGTGE